jgi:hypothetical protein
MLLSKTTEPDRTRKDHIQLSSTEQSGVRIEGCGSSNDSRPTRTPRYGFASPFDFAQDELNLLGMLLT